MKKINYKSLSTLLLFVSSLFISYSLIVNLNNSSSSQGNIYIQSPSASQLQGSNQFYQWILVENLTTTHIAPYLIFEFDSDIDLRIAYTIAGIDSPTRKSQIYQESKTNIILDAGTNNLTIPITLNIAAFPGEYYYILIISIFNQDSNENLEDINIVQGIVRLTMGGTWAIILFGLSLIGIFFILNKEETLREEPSDVKNSAEVYDPTLTPSPIDQLDKSGTDTPTISEDVESGFIKCPDCKKKIKEGSAFCPECGYHIPKFLRVNQG